MIHQYKIDDLAIVIDINSGSVHVLDDCSYDYVELLDKNLEHEEIVKELQKKYVDADFEEVRTEIDELIRAKVLFTQDSYDHVVHSFKDRETVVKAMCLHIAHDCNLACKYCFAEEGEYHGDRSLMSFEVGKQAIDYLVANSGNRKNLEIDFFGGEPLMNFDVVKQIVHYAKSLEQEHHKNFRFTITTNGVLLSPDKIEFINEHMYNVVLSCDGRKEVHDFMRPSSNKKGSYDLVMPKFQELVKARGNKSYYIRGTFTRHNLDFSEDVMHMYEQGFSEISVEPVVAPLDEDYAIQKEDIGILQKEYERLAKRILEVKEQGGKLNFFHFMVDLSGGPCVYKRLTGCGSGTDYLAVTPQGDLYPCHQFVGMEEFRMGDVFSGIERQDLVTDFKSCNVYSKKECIDCWAKFYCSGGCNANGYNHKGSIHAVYDMGCDLEKKRVECAIYLKAKEMLA